MAALTAAARAPHEPPRRAVRALALSAGARAFADIALYAYLPLHAYAALGERRLWLIGLILAVPHLARVPAAPLWGRLLDRRGRFRTLLVGGLLAYAAALVAVAALRDAAAILAAVCALALPASAYTPAARAYLVRWGEAGHAALARWLRAESAGWLAGSAALTLLAGARAPVLPTLVAALALLAAAAVARQVPEPPAAGVRGPAATDDLPPAWGLVRGTVAYVALAGLLAEGVFAVLGIYLTQALGAPPALYGAAITGSTLLGLWAYGPLGRVAAGGGAPRLLVAAALGYAASFALLLVPHPWVAAAGYVPPMYAAVRVGATVLAAAGAGPGARGRAMGLLDAAEALGAGLGGLLGGLAADRWGLRAPIAAACAGSALLLAAAAVVARHAGRLRAGPAGGVGTTRG